MTESLTHSPQETEALAASLVAKLEPGSVIGLEGDLGAGKTVFVKGIARALGITATVQSPTFIIMQVYPLQHQLFKRLVHVDCYRLDDSDALRAIGLEEYLDDGESLVVIEWADRVRDMLPSNAVRVTLTSADEVTRRIGVTLPGHGSGRDR